MHKNHDTEPQNSENKNPLEIFASAITNMLRWANGKENLQHWGRFALKTLVSCFKGAKKETFLTEKPLNNALETFKANHGRLRSAIRNNTEVTLAVVPCSDLGMILPPSSFNDQSNDLCAYFRILYSVPEDPQGLALGMGNIKPAPFLTLLPDEFIKKCSFVVKWPSMENPAGQPSGQSGTKGDDQDDNDYQYLASQIKEKYQMLQSLVHSHLK